MGGQCFLSLAMEKVEILLWLSVLSLSVEEVVWPMLDSLCVEELEVNMEIEIRYQCHSLPGLLYTVDAVHW